MTKNKHIGSSLDDLLKETGDFTETTTIAVKRVIAWQITQKMESEQITKTHMAEMMDTSRSSLDRLLNPDNTSVTLHTLDNAAKAIGKSLRIALV
jgi:antitoxin HicB